MRFSAFNKMLTNNHRFKPADPEYRRVYLMNIVLMLSVLFAAVFAVLNISTYSYFEAVVDGICAVFILVTLFYFHKTDNINISSHAVVIFIFLAIASTFGSVGQHHYILSWVSVFPPIAFFLLGRKKAVVVLALMVAVLLVYIWVYFDEWSAYGFSIRSAVNIVGTYAALTLLVWYFELSRSEAVSDARQKNSALDKANTALKENREHLRRILDSTAEAIFGIDMDNKCTFCNKRCLELLGYAARTDIVGKDIHELIHSRQKDKTPLLKSACNIIRTYTERAAAHSDTEVFWRSDGTSLDVEYYSHPQYKDGELNGAVVTFKDNTLKKKNALQMEYFSSHDVLTGLMNRHHFETQLRRADTKENLPISIIMADLNGLKLSNDVFGHDVGDKLIKKAAEALRKSCRDNEIIARMGGDEFAILLEKTQYSDAVRIISRIKDALAREKVDIIQCSMSLGCDTKTLTSQSIDLTQKNAENEMYKDKAKNRNKVDAEFLNMITTSLYRRCPSEEQHSENVEKLCRTLGRAFGLSETETAQLERAGALHDIGKICIGEDILNKKGAFSEEEKIAFKQHPVIGYRLLNLFDNTLSLAEAVYSHHERWNGTGYPRALKAGEIPLAARIIAIAGRYDQYVSGYHEKSVGHEKALRLLEEDAGVLFDPKLVNVFCRMMREYPPE